MPTADRLSVVIHMDIMQKLRYILQVSITKHYQQMKLQLNQLNGMFQHNKIILLFLGTEIMETEHIKFG